MFRKIHISFYIGLVLTLILLWPLMSAGYFSHHDDLQVIRTLEMQKCLLDLQIPCRWVPDLGGLYGYPLFNYYAPLPYYFGAVVNLLINNLLISAKLMFAASFVGSYVFMYLLGKRLWGSGGGLISGVFYSYAPYHSLDFYVRGAMGEMWALMFFPAVLWGFLKLKEERSLNNTFLSGILLGLLIISHNLSAMIFMVILLGWITLLGVTKWDLKFLKLSVVGIVIGLGLSAFYFLPSYLEKDLVHIETTVGGYFSYTEHFKGIKKLFIERDWGWGSSEREVPGGPKDGLSYQIGWVHLLGWVLGLGIVILLWRLDKTKLATVGFFTLVALGGIFMVHPLSEPVWRLIEPLKYLQFPWRFLMFVILSLSIISGGIVWGLEKSNIKLKELVYIALIFLVVALNLSYFRPEKFYNVKEVDYLTGQGWDSQVKRSIFDYLPKSAKAPPAALADKRYEVIGDMNIYDYKEGTNWIHFNAVVNKESDIRLSQYYFPNFEILANNKKLEIDSKNDLGLMTIKLSPGKYNIDAQLKNTPIRFIGNLISLTTFIVLVGVWVKNKSYGKR